MWGKKRKAKSHRLLLLTIHSDLLILHYPLVLTCLVRTYQLLRLFSLFPTCPHRSLHPHNQLLTCLLLTHAFLIPSFLQTAPNPSLPVISSWLGWSLQTCCSKSSKLTFLLHGNLILAQVWDSSPPLSLLAYSPTCHWHCPPHVCLPSPGLPLRSPSSDRVIKYLVQCLNQRKYSNKPWKQEKRTFPGKKAAIRWLYFILKTPRSLSFNWAKNGSFNGCLMGDWLQDWNSKPGPNSQNFRKLRFVIVVWIPVVKVQSKLQHSDSSPNFPYFCAVSGFSVLNWVCSSAPSLSSVLGVEKFFIFILVASTVFVLEVHNT